MTSEFAASEIEKMWSEGLHPTVDDIVRLNALGLKIDHDDGAAALYRTRRAAFVGDVVLREPTIGHQLYIADVCRGFDATDSVTFILLRAWALSEEFERLPQIHSAHGVMQVVSDFCRDHFTHVTFRRLARAVEYVLYGCDSAALVSPIVVNDESKDALKNADDESLDAQWSFEVGVIHEAEALGLGITLADAKRHTCAELNAIVEHAVEERYAHTNMRGGRDAVLKARKNLYLGRFYSTLEAIRKRLNDHQKD